MREESQARGHHYQQAVKAWLTGWRLFRKSLQAFGDAYDATRHAARVGNSYYDLSLQVGEVGHAEQVLYIECKYRRRPGLLKGELGKAILNAYTALGEVDRGQWDETTFCFVTSVPPESWSSYLTEPHDFVMTMLSKESVDLDEDRIHQLLDNFHVLVATPPILGIT